MHVTTAIVSLIVALSSTAYASPQGRPTLDCRNVDPKKPFFLSVEYTNPKGKFVAQDLQEYDGLHSSTLMLRLAGHNEFHETKFEFQHRRLTFNSTASPSMPGGTVTSMNAKEGQPFGFSLGDKNKGNLALIDTDIPNEGDAGCAVAVDSYFKVRGFTVCDDVIHNQVVYWKKHSKKANCFDVTLVARNDKA